MTDDAPALTVAELAARWRGMWGTAAPSPAGIRRRIDNGTLPAVNLNPGGVRPRYVIPMASVLAFEARTHQQ